MSREFIELRRVFRGDERLLFVGCLAGSIALQAQSCKREG
jgi:hypothetical protein